MNGSQDTGQLQHHITRQACRETFKPLSSYPQQRVEHDLLQVTDNSRATQNRLTRSLNPEYNIRQPLSILIASL